MFHKIKPPRIVVLDNDECLGQFSLFSILIHYAKSPHPIPIDLNAVKQACIKHLFPNGTARPYIKHLFKLLAKLKQMKKIDKVVMYTSAPNTSNNQSGYIYFLKDCLETYCKTPKLYELVFHRNNIQALVSQDGATIKDLGNVVLPNQKLRQKLLQFNSNNSKFIKLVNHLTKKTIMIDDKPQNIRNRFGKRYGVSAYTVIPHLKHIYNCINDVPNFKAKLINLGVYHDLCHTFFRDYKQHLTFLQTPNQTKYNKDAELLKMCYLINKTYNN